MKNRKGPKDVESVAAMEMLVMESRPDAMAEAMKGAREKASAVLFREAGSIETLNFTRAQAEFFMLVKLKRVKEAKEYREKLDMTWTQFCDSVGVKWRTIDDQLASLKGLKTEFLTAFVNFSGFDFNKIRYLAEDKLTDSVKIHGNLIVYDGQEIAITPENKDEIQALLERIEDKYKTDLENASAEARAHKKIVKQKEELIVKQEKDLRKFEKRAEGRGLSPEEDAFEGQVENFRIAFDGYMTRIEPMRMEELQSGDDSKVTPRMRAAYLEALGYMRRQIISAHDTAVEMFGADLEDQSNPEWKRNQ